MKEKNQENNIKVYLRLRPLNDLEKTLGGQVCVTNNKTDVELKYRNHEDDETLIYKYKFDRIFGIVSQQEEVFEVVAKPIIRSAMEGFNGTIFAYGQTSSGKTHTMEGPDINCPKLKGVIPRMFDYIFDCINQASIDIEFQVKVSMFEIYNEKIQDLLDIDRINLQIKEDSNRGIYVQGLLELNVANQQQMLDVMQQGSENRSIAATRMNEKSSRSHSLFQMKKDNVNDETRSGKLFFVDLAGSEKLSKTQAQGKQLEEAKNINRSLSALGLVINALSNPESQFIPYRDSKLTRILQESLGGNSKTSLILASSICSYNDKEIMSTFRFGQRAKNIRNKPIKNVEKSAKELQACLNQALQKINKLQIQIQILEGQHVDGQLKSVANNSIADKKDQEQVQKLFQQHEAIKQLTEENEQSQSEISQLKQELIKVVTDSDNLQNKLQVQKEFYNRKITNYLEESNINLQEFELNLLNIQKDKQVREKIKEQFQDFYMKQSSIQNHLMKNYDSELSIDDQLVVSQKEEKLRNLDKKYSEMLRNIENSKDQENKKIHQQWQEMESLCGLQKQMIEKFKNVNNSQQQKMEKLNRDYIERQKGYKKKVESFVTNMKFQNQKYIDKYKKQVEKTGTLNNQIDMQKKVIQKYDQFLKSKENKIDDLKVQLKQQENLIKEDQEKARLLYVEKQMLKIIRETNQLREKNRKQSEQISEQSQEIGNKDTIIDNLQNKIIELNTQTDNLKVLMKEKIANSNNKSNHNLQVICKASRQKSLQDINKTVSPTLLKHTLEEKAQNNSGNFKIAQNLYQNEEHSNSFMNDFSFDQLKVVSPIIGGKMRLSLRSNDTGRKMSIRDKSDGGDSFFEELDYIDEEDNSSKSNEFSDQI